MNSLILPSEYTKVAPWILDKKSLNSLSDYINKIEKMLDDKLEEAILKETQKRLKNCNFSDKEKNFDDIKKETSQFYKNETIVKIYAKENKILKGQSLKELLKDPNLDNLQPTQIEIEINKYHFRYKFEINEEHNKLTYRIIDIYDKNEQLINNIHYETNLWIEENSQNIIIQKWFSWSFNIVYFISLILFAFIVNISISSASSEQYKSVLNKEGRSLLINGLDKNETIKALEILLKKEVNFVPKNYKTKTKFNKDNIFYIIIITIFIIILSIKPRTIIGIGKNQQKVYLYQLWIKFILFFIPVSIILPILINKI